MEPRAAEISFCRDTGRPPVHQRRVGEGEELVEERWLLVRRTSVRDLRPDRRLFVSPLGWTPRESGKEQPRTPETSGWRSGGGSGNALKDVFCKVLSFKGVVKTCQNNHLEKKFVSLARLEWAGGRGGALIGWSGGGHVTGEGGSQLLVTQQLSAEVGFGELTRGRKWLGPPQPALVRQCLFVPQGKFILEFPSFSHLITERQSTEKMRRSKGER